MSIYDLERTSVKSVCVPFLTDTPSQTASHPNRASEQHGAPAGHLVLPPARSVSAALAGGGGPGDLAYPPSASPNLAHVGILPSTYNTPATLGATAAGILPANSARPTRQRSNGASHSVSVQGRSPRARAMRLYAAILLAARMRTPFLGQRETVPRASTVGNPPECLPSGSARARDAHGATGLA